MASARIGIGISAVYALAILASPSTAQTSGTTSRSIPDAAITKAEALVARMTLDEKLPQLLNVAPAIPRLGIPRYNWWTESLHGAPSTLPKTNFPEPIGRGATLQTPMVKHVPVAPHAEVSGKRGGAPGRESECETG